MHFESAYLRPFATTHYSMQGRPEHLTALWVAQIDQAVFAGRLARVAIRSKLSHKKCSLSLTESSCRLRHGGSRFATRSVIKSVAVHCLFAQRE